MLNTIKTKSENKTMEGKEKDRQNKMFERGSMTFALVALCVLFDVWVFYIRFDSIVYNKKIVILLMAVACAVAMDVFPIVVINNYMKLNKTKETKILYSTFGILFLIVAGLTVALGIVGASELAGNLPSMMKGIASLSVERQVTLSQMVVSVLIGFMPVVTSALIISISYVDAKTNQYGKTIQK